MPVCTTVNLCPNVRKASEACSERSRISFGAPVSYTKSRATATHRKWDTRSILCTVCSIVCTIRTLICSISRLKRKSCLHNLKGKGNGSLHCETHSTGNAEPTIAHRPLVTLPFWLSVPLCPCRDPHDARSMPTPPSHPAARLSHNRTKPTNSAGHPLRLTPAYIVGRQ
jgi:hypothetical protein